MTEVCEGMRGISVDAKKNRRRPQIHYVTYRLTRTRTPAGKEISRWPDKKRKKGEGSAARETRIAGQTATQDRSGDGVDTYRG